MKESMNLSYVHQEKHKMNNSVIDYYLLQNGDLKNLLLCVDVWADRMQFELVTSREKILSKYKK